VALTVIDKKLLDRCLANEPGAWKDFVDRFHGLFVHVVNHTAHVRSVRLSQDDVDDLCAEVFLTLLANNYAVLQHFQGRCSLATYLSVIARRAVVKEMTHRRKAEALGHVSVHQSAIDQADLAPSELQRVANHDEIQQMLDNLPTMDAEVIKQFHLEGRTYREISSELGIPENSIGPTLTRARAKLRGSKVGS
jgi:RNA polymerase sigma-70 factor (ECF subfamily)